MMPDSDETYIWSPETGITDYSTDPFQLASGEARQIRDEWLTERSSLEDSAAVREFTEQLHREWSIETGIIENLYDIDRGVTQTLIEQGFQESLLVHGSINKEPEYILNLLQDQKQALESLFAFVKREQPLTNHYIRELHQLMTNSQGISEAQDLQGNFVQMPLLKGEWKKQPNFPIRNGVVYRYCPPEQVGSEMDRLVNLHSEHLEHGVPPEVEAAWLHHRFSQIHPFMDGNGRIARALASLVLIRGGLFPFVIPREEKAAYITCLEMADSGDLRPLIRTIARRQEVAYLKAVVAIRRARSVPEDYIAAAAYLGDVVRETLEQRTRRVLVKIGTLRQSLWSILSLLTKTASRALRQEALLEDHTGLLISCEQNDVAPELIQKARDLIIRDSGDFVPEPVSFNLIRVFVLGGAELVFLAYAPLPEASDRVTLRACLISPEERLLTVAPWQWSDHGQLNTDSLQKWLQEAIRVLLLDLARSS